MEIYIQYKSMHVMFNNQQVKQFIHIKAIGKGGGETNTKRSDDCNGGGWVRKMFSKKSGGEDRKLLVMIGF